MQPQPPPLSNVLGALYARVPLGMRLGLEAMRAACTRSGHPEAAFPVVHVGGTNGKGSTSAMVEAMARASGMRTGLYTSPHLTRFAERIRIDGEPIADDALTALLDEALAVGADLSFFETATLAALLAFRAAKVDLAVIEVGIGGRLDATNVVPPPRCAAVTRVALDHQDRLGETLEAIAREKAAIAKPGSPIVLGRMPAPVRAAAEEVARAAGARVIALDDEAPPRLPAEIGLPGRYQKDNAEVAWRIAEVLGIDEGARARGLAAARWPGRFERVETPDGPVLLDGAHNPDGIHALVSAVRAGREPIGAVVFGALADKAWRAMEEELGAIDAPRFHAAPQGRAAAPLEGTQPLGEALAAARRAAGPSRVVLVCGSIYLVGEARGRLLGLPADPPVAL